MKFKMNWPSPKFVVCRNKKSPLTREMVLITKNICLYMCVTKPYCLFLPWECSPYFYWKKKYEEVFLFHNIYVTINTVPEWNVFEHVCKKLCYILALNWWYYDKPKRTGTMLVYQYQYWYCDKLKRTGTIRINWVKLEI